MRKSISLDQAEYKSALAESLFESIIEKSSAECSDSLRNHILLACDLNREIHQALIFALETGDAK